MDRLRLHQELYLLGHDDEGLTASDIARRVGANRASCVHMLAALEAAGFVARGAVDRRYRLGPALVGLGAAAARAFPGLETARRELDELTRKALYELDPFVTLDQKGVGELITMAIERGRAANPALKIGICGEHAGDPASLDFFASLKVDYVSCSPYRVPIARLALAQAAR